MKEVFHDGRGMALALTLVALVIIGALVAGALFSGTEEQRMAENTRFQQRAFGVAEQALYGTLAAWPAASRASAGRRAYPLDSAAPLVTEAGTASPRRTSSSSGTVYRLTSTLYLLDVTGRDTASPVGAFRGVSQRLGMLIRIVPPEAHIRAALTLGGPVPAADGAIVLNGTDTTPVGGAWSGCGPTEASMAGAISTPDTSARYVYGSADYTMLSARASALLAPGSYSPAPVVVSGVCETDAQPSNWGDGNDHTSPCGAYFPVVWLRGDPPYSNGGTWSISGGQGQGVLLVDGDLSVTGQFTFYGLMVVRGSLTVATGASANVYGAVSAGGVALGPGGSVVVNWSSCALTDALLQGGVAAPARSRSWVQLY